MRKFGFSFHQSTAVVSSVLGDIALHIMYLHAVCPCLLYIFCTLVIVALLFISPSYSIRNSSNKQMNRLLSSSTGHENVRLQDDEESYGGLI